MEELPVNEEQKQQTSEDKALKSLRKLTSERDAPKRRITLHSILGGDILQGEWVRRNVGLIILIVFFALLYVGNGYVSQQETIEIDRLKRQVDSARNIALIRSCEFLENSRQSYVEESLKEKGDSTLQMSTVPPYIIKIDTAE